ncbi:MAG TPA: hypothetical protein VF787_18345 [Thermoanaerobaculia bacterium]
MAKRKDERLRAVLDRVRDLLVASATIEVTDARKAIVVENGRLSLGTARVQYSIGPLAMTVDFESLASVMLELADSMFEVFDVTFKDGGTMRDAVNHKVAAAIRTIDDTALNILADYVTELAFQGAALATEEFASEVFNRTLTKSEMKLFRSISRDVAEALLASRIPNVGRGGVTRVRDPLPDDVLVRFFEAAERVHPFWRDVADRARRGDETWQQDAKRLPEYRRFTKAERHHADATIVLLHRGRKVNGARPAPRVLAREHARLLVGLEVSSDGTLRQHEREGRALLKP